MPVLLRPPLCVPRPAWEASPARSEAPARSCAPPLTWEDRPERWSSPARLFAPCDAFPERWPASEYLFASAIRLPPRKPDSCLLASAPSLATVSAASTPWWVNFVNRFFPSLPNARTSSGLTGRTALNTSLPIWAIRANRAAPEVAFSPADAAVPVPAVAIAMSTSGSRCPMARPGSSVHVSQSTSALPRPAKNAPGSSHSAFARPAMVSIGIVLCLA